MVQDKVKSTIKLANITQLNNLRLVRYYLPSDP